MYIELGRVVTKCWCRVTPSCQPRCFLNSWVSCDDGEKQPPHFPMPVLWWTHCIAPCLWMSDSRCYSIVGSIPAVHSLVCKYHISHQGEKCQSLCIIHLPQWACSFTHACSVTHTLRHTHKNTHTQRTQWGMITINKKDCCDGEEIRSSNNIDIDIVILYRGALGYPGYAQHISEMFNMQHKVLSLCA